MRVDYDLLVFLIVVSVFVFSFVLFIFDPFNNASAEWADCVITNSCIIENITVIK